MIEAAMASPIRSWTALRTSARWDRPGAVTVFAGAAVSMATTSLFRTGPASEQRGAAAEVNSGYRFETICCNRRRRVATGVGVYPPPLERRFQGGRRGPARDDVPAGCVQLASWPISASTRPRRLMPTELTPGSPTRLPKVLA